MFHYTPLKAGAPMTAFPKRPKNAEERYALQRIKAHGDEKQKPPSCGLFSPRTG